MKYVASDGFKPKMTFRNSFWAFLVALIGSAILRQLLIVVIPLFLNDTETIKDLNAVVNIAALLLAIWFGRRLAYRNLIKKHENSV